MKNSRGSVWRKWDLHVHSPASKQANSYPKFAGKPDWDPFIKALEELSDVAVVGITDYFSIEGYKKILEFQAARRLENIELILPNIEFRLEEKNKDNEHINLHIIFSEELALNTSKIESFLENIELSNVTEDGSTASCKTSDLEAIGYDKAIVKLEKIESALNKTFGKQKPYLMAGVANGYGGIRPPQNDSGRRAEYAKIIDEKVDFFFGRSSDKRFFLNVDNARYTGSKEKAVIQGSDARSIEDINNWVGKEAEIAGENGHKELKEITWIKADTSFDGLSKALCEPDDRFYIGPEPPKIVDVQNNKAQYLKRFSIKGNTGADWFDDDLIINPGLVAVIGKKGSGKSALADMIAHAAGAKVSKKNYSFLHEDRFLKNKHRASLYSAEVEWEDSTSNAKLLTDDSTEDPTERVKYLPQKYVEEICDPFGMTNEFQKEINGVIFSYVEPEDRLGTANLEELVETHSKVINKELIGKRIEINDINSLIVKLEEKLNPDYLVKLNALLDQKKQDLKNLEEPKKVPKPKNTLPKAEQEKAKKLQTTIKTFETEIEKAEASLEETNLRLRSIDNIKQQVELSKVTIDKAIENITADLRLTGLDISKILQLKVNKRPITKIEKELVEKRNNLLTVLERDGEEPSKESLLAKKQQATDALAIILSKLDLKNKRYHEYQQQKEEFEKRKKEIIGNKDDRSLETITSLANEISYVGKKIKQELQELHQDRQNRLDELYDIIESKSGFYEEIYNPVIKKLEAEKKKQRNAESLLSFNVSTVFDKEKFSKEFLASIHQGRRGSFQGNEKGEKVLKQLMDKHDLRSKKGVGKFLEELLILLSKDYQSNQPEKPSVNIEDQLMGSKLELYNLLFRMPYIDVKYSVLFNGKDLNENEFSPGEKGALLLIFYLLVDKGKIPLIIDQPEENLDNESVFRLLVPYIKAAKNQRQVIIVTHNPNLAVVCDAEQIIHADMDKKKERIRYTSGALENKVINRKVSDILEGTLLAFNVRHLKYHKI